MVHRLVGDRVLREAELPHVSVEWGLLHALVTKLAAVCDDATVLEALEQLTLDLVDEVREEALVVHAVAGQEAEDVQLLRRPIGLEETCIEWNKVVCDEETIEEEVNLVESRACVDGAPRVGARGVHLVACLAIEEDILGGAVPGAVIRIEDHGESGERVAFLDLEATSLQTQLYLLRDEILQLDVQI